jgi:tetratricopeptide (TPR) repeat protein
MSSETLRTQLVILFLAVLHLSAAHAEETWTEVRSPHFRVITNGPGSDGRKVANEFEQMRRVFVQRFNDENLESGPPLTIIAAFDGDTFKDLDPATWKNTQGKIAGAWYHGWEIQFALVRMDTGVETPVDVYHEYTHSVLHARFHWLPFWFDEGFAEFYGYTRFESDGTYIGAPSRRFSLLQQSKPFKVSEMLETTRNSPLYHDLIKTQLFYAEAWAMVHYMIVGPGMNNGAKMSAFITLLQDEVPQQKAFEQTFGDLKKFDDNFLNYIRGLSMKAYVLPPDKGMNPKTFTETKLTPAQTDFEIGRFKIHIGERTAGHTWLDTALSLNPNLAAAHEELGFLYFREGKDADADDEWKKALALDPNLYRSLFASTMSGPSLASQTPDQLHATQKTLQHITEIAPAFAPAYVELALAELQLGTIQQAYKDAAKAEALEPWRAGYHVLTGRILLRGKQPALAAKYARYVAGHWTGPDHNEAVDLWLAVPPTERGEDPPLALETPTNTTTLTGTVQEVACGAIPDARLTVTFRPDTPTNAEPITFQSDGRLMIGFSDTFWWGEDHYTRCHHLAGHHGTIAYREQDHTLLDLEVRDDLPESQPARTAEPTTTTPTQP